jgi:hypothetical protein
MDWGIVLTHHGPEAAAYGVHEATAILMLAAAGLRLELPDGTDPSVLVPDPRGKGSRQSAATTRFPAPGVLRGC